MSTRAQNENQSFLYVGVGGNFCWTTPMTRWLIQQIAKSSLDMIRRYATKTYRRGKVLRYAFFNLGTRQRWEVSFTPRPFVNQYPLERRLGGPVGMHWQEIEPLSSRSHTNHYNKLPQLPELTTHININARGTQLVQLKRMCWSCSWM